MVTRKRVDGDITREIFEMPALWDGESEEGYLDLLAAFKNEMGSSSLFEMLRAHDLTAKIWEERRFKRVQGALIHSARVEALTALLAAHFGDDREEALETAQNYFSGVPERRRPVKTLLADMGITSEQIEANALHLRSSGVQTLDRMIVHRETARVSLMKAHEKRQRRLDKAKERSCTVNEAREQTGRVVRIARAVRQD